MAWFKQMTCDTCYKVLPNIGRHNRYYFVRYEKVETVPMSSFLQNRQYYSSVFNLHVAAGSYMFCYRLQDQLSPNAYSSWFCSNKCAVEETKRLNCIAFYFDELMNSVAIVVPQLPQINSLLGKSSFDGSRINGIPAEKWLQKPSDYEDRSMYGVSSVFPTLSYSKGNLIAPSNSMVADFLELMTDSDFDRLYFGSGSKDVAQRVRNSFPNDYQAETQRDFGRRAEVLWFITNMQKQFVGFIHLTQKFKAMPGSWVLEFGLKNQYRNQGIMTNVVATVLKWAKSEGCDEPIFAVSEDYNFSCHRLLRKIPFHVTESIAPMNDEWAGLRQMHIFKIDL